MSDQTPNLAALEALAEAATPGPWVVDESDYDLRVILPADGTPGVAVVCEGIRQGYDEGEADAAYIAAADPSTVLWLIRELRDAHAGLTAVIAQRDEQEVFAKRAEAELASIRAAARPDRFRCCECCKTEHLAEGREDDDLIDNHEIACQHCQDPEKRRAEKAEATIERVRAALANHPRACEAHPEDDPISCGWKRAVLDVQTALDGGEPDA